MLVLLVEKHAFPCTSLLLKVLISVYFTYELCLTLTGTAEKDDVVVIKYGALLSAIMRFFIVSLALFFIVRGKIVFFHSSLHHSTFLTSAYFTSLLKSVSLQTEGDARVSGLLPVC